MKHDALRVDDGPQGEWTGLSRALHDARRQGLGRRRRGPLLENTGALLLERLADKRCQARPRESADLLLIPELAEELIDRGQAPERGGAVSAHRARPRPSPERGR